jgi:hypothetical protein
LGTLLCCTNLDYMSRRNRYSSSGGRRPISDAQRSCAVSATKKVAAALTPFRAHTTYLLSHTHTPDRPPAQLEDGNMFRPRIRLPRAGLLRQPAVTIVPRRFRHEVPVLKNFRPDEGVPGLLEAGGFDLAWTQYMQFTMDKLNALTDGVFDPKVPPGCYSSVEALANLMLPTHRHRV